MDTVREGGRGELREQHGDRHAAICKPESQRAHAVRHRELSPELRDNLEGWGDGRETGGRLRREGTCVCLWLLHVGWQRLAQHCKAVIFQRTILKNIKARQTGALPWLECRPLA